MDKVCLRLPGHKKHTQDREAGDASACDGLPGINLSAGLYHSDASDKGR